MYDITGGWIPSACPFTGFFYERSLSFRSSRASPERVASSYPLLRSLGRASLNASEAGAVKKERPSKEASALSQGQSRISSFRLMPYPTLWHGLISQDLPELLTLSDSHRASGLALTDGKCAVSWCFVTVDPRPISLSPPSLGELHRADDGCQGWRPASILFFFDVSCSFRCRSP